jgi:transposase
VLTLPPSVKVFAATQAIDGRKGVDSLASIVRSVFREDPLSGHLFVFFSRRFDRVRVMYWDRNGFAMWSKRLEKGRYRFATVDGALKARLIEWSDLALVLEGIELRGATRRARWEPRSSRSAIVRTASIL